MPDETDVPAFTADAGIPIRRAKWAIVKDGVIDRVKHSYDFFRHPFGDEVKDAYHAPLDGRQMVVPMNGLAVIQVTGNEVAEGYLVDTKGNVTPTEGRTETLAPGQPAYHAGPGHLRTTADVAAQLQGGEPITEKQIQAPEGAPVEKRDENEPSLGMSQPHVSTEHLERADEHHEDDTAEHEDDKPTGFAAVDAKAHD